MCMSYIGRYVTGRRNAVEAAGVEGTHVAGQGLLGSYIAMLALEGADSAVLDLAAFFTRNFCCVTDIAQSKAYSRNARECVRSQ